MLALRFNLLVSSSERALKRCGDLGGTLWTGFLVDLKIYNFFSRELFNFQFSAVE
jgi:hypothetical protein